MRVQWKVTLLVFLVLVGTLSAVIWKTRALVLKDRLGFMADAAMKQMAPLKRLVEERLDEQRAKLVAFAAARAQNANTARAKTPEDFDVLALVQSGDGGQWTPSWIEKSKAARPELWPAGYDLTLLKSLPYARVKDGETLWARLSDQQGAPIYAMLMSVEIQGAQTPEAATGTLPETTDYASRAAGGRRAILVGFASHGPLSDLSEDYIGSSNTVYIVDDKGYVASHVNKSFHGALFTEDPIVGEIVSQKKTAASGTYEDLDSRPVLGHFERIDRTNLYAVVTSPLSGAQELVDAHMRTALVSGLSVGVIGLILAWILGRSFSTTLSEALLALQAFKRGERFEVRPLATKDEVGELSRLLADGLGAPGSLAAISPPSPVAPSPVPEPPPEPKFENQTESKAPVPLNSGFADAVKEPVLAILGHAQLIKVKSTEESVRTHAESVEREARRAKDVLERLQTWTNQTAPTRPGETVDLREVVENTAARLEAELSEDGVRLSLDVHDVPRVPGSFEKLKVAFANLIDNARTAMSARNPKHLRVRLEFVGDTITLKVEDNGVGMSRDVSTRAFEPFFKGFQAPKHMGLGLSVVRSVVASMGGECAIEGLPGEGATVSLKFPVSEKEQEEFRSAQSAKLLNKVAEQITPMPEIAEDSSASEPAGASVAPTSPAALRDPGPLSATPSMLGEDDDDDDDMFASVSLGKSNKTSEPQVEAGGGESGFRVKIRRPKARS